MLQQKEIDQISKIIADPEKTKAVLQVIQESQARSHAQQKKLQADGIQAAKARGVQFGRPQLKITKKFLSVYEQYQKKEISATAAAQALKISRTSFHRLIKRYEAETGGVANLAAVPSAVAQE